MKLKHAFFSLSVAMLLLCTTAAYGQQAKQVLTPLFVDLKGWEAQNTAEMNMSANGVALTTASRNYVQGDKDFHVTLTISNQPIVNDGSDNISVKTDNTIVETQEIDGFKTFSVYEKNKKEGTLLVYLSHDKQKASVLTFTYKGIDYHQSVELAKKFAWKAMQETVSKLPVASK